MSQYLYTDPSGRKHVLTWPKNSTEKWSCSCGAVEGFKYCQAVSSLLHSVDFVGPTQYSYDAKGNVFNYRGERMVDLGVNDQGVIFDDDGMC